MISGSKLEFRSDRPPTELPDLLCDFGKLLPSAGPLQRWCTWWWWVDGKMMSGRSCSPPVSAEAENASRWASRPPFSGNTRKLFGMFLLAPGKPRPWTDAQEAGEEAPGCSPRLGCGAQDLEGHCSALLSPWGPRGTGWGRASSRQDPPSSQSRVGGGLC